MNIKRNLFSFLLFLFFLNSFFFIKISNAVQFKKDEEILNILTTADKGEIDAADAILKKSVSTEVKQYAQMLKTDHAKNLNMAINLSRKRNISLIKTQMSQMLERQGKRSINQLTPLTHKDLEHAYMQMMIKDHNTVIHMLDHNLIPNASDPILKQLLLHTRPHLEKHLNMAYQIQKNIH